MFRKGFILVLAIFALAAFASGQAKNGYDFSKGGYAVERQSTTLEDGSRGWDDNGRAVPTRQIPIKVSSPPAREAGPFPLLLMSHELGGNAGSSSYLARYLAAHGYIVVSVQHRGSDSDYLDTWGARALTKAAAMPATRLARPKDLSFVLDSIAASRTGLGLLDSSRVDMGKVGVLGHSFGAFATLACLGASFDGGVDASDGRFLCGVAYSPQGPGTLGSEKSSWGSLARPVMTLAGTADVSIGTTNPAERRIAYDSMPATGDKYHVTLSGATHDSFDDGARDGGRYYDCVERLTLAFFDAYLRGDPKALAWLKGESIEAEGKYAMQECK